MDLRRWLGVKRSLLHIASFSTLCKNWICHRVHLIASSSARKLQCWRIATHQAATSRRSTRTSSQDACTRALASHAIPTRNTCFYLPLQVRPRVEIRVICKCVSRTPIFGLVALGPTAFTAMLFRGDKTTCECARAFKSTAMRYQALRASP